MFTGLIQDVGTVEQISFGGMAQLWVRASIAGQDLKLGESIAVDGACLTIAELKPGAFRVEASAETLRRTTLGSLERGSRVNLERSMTLGDRLGATWCWGTWMRFLRFCRSAAKAIRRYSGSRFPRRWRRC